MDLKTELTPQDWATLRKMAREGALPFSAALVDKIKAGDRAWTHQNAMAIHLATGGNIPCWCLLPNVWAPGQIPPGVHDSSLPTAC